MRRTCPKGSTWGPKRVPENYDAVPAALTNEWLDQLGVPNLQNLWIVSKCRRAFPRDIRQPRLCVGPRFIRKRKERGEMCAQAAEHGVAKRLPGPRARHLVSPIGAADAESSKSFKRPVPN